MARTINKNSLKNLKPGGDAHKLTDEDRAKGRRNRKENTLRRKELKECLDILLEKEITSASGVTMTGAEAISAKLFEQALKGDKKAFEIIRDTAGQKPVEKIQMATIEQKTIDDIEKIFKSNGKKRSDKISDN